MYVPVGTVCVYTAYIHVGTCLLHVHHQFTEHWCFGKGTFIVLCFATTVLIPLQQWSVLGMFVVGSNGMGTYYVSGGCINSDGLPCTLLLMEHAVNHIHMYIAVLQLKLLSIYMYVSQYQNS